MQRLPIVDRKEVMEPKREVQAHQTTGVVAVAAVVTSLKQSESSTRPLLKGTVSTPVIRSPEATPRRGVLVSLKQPQRI